MADQAPRLNDGWGDDCADLPARCRAWAGQAAGLLRSVIADEARRWIDQGFVVPSVESLHHAADVFDGIAALDGGEYWLQRPDPAASLHVVCALASAVEGLEREWDLSALSGWWQWRDGPRGDVIAQAMGARAMVNAGGIDRAVEILKTDIARAERDYGANR